MSNIDAVISAALDNSELSYQHTEPGKFFVALPGITKLRTNCWLIADQRGLLIEAFVCRKPDENELAVYQFLLRRNAKLYGVHYTIDAAGDIYLIGRVSLSSVTEPELDRILGQVLEAADGDFNSLLELGFSGAIKREWQWRISRGESLANLRAFAHLLESEPPRSPQ